MPLNKPGEVIAGLHSTRVLATSDNTLGCQLRLPAAAFDPTGKEQGEEQNWVAWLREQQYFSSRDWAGSATAGTS
jgi:hypothetical protein